MIVIVITILLLALILIRVPVPFAILISGALGLLFTGGPRGVIGVFQVIPLSSVSSYSLSAIPLFILMAQFVLKSGALDSLFRSAATIVGRLPGGTGIAAVMAGAAFAAVSGSSTAAAATLAHTSSGEMIKQGYSPRLATGTVASAGTLAAMIPPSVLLVFYSITAETSVGAALIAGVVPGILMALALAVTVVVLALRGLAPKGHKSRMGEKLRSIVGLVPVGLLFLVVMGAVFLGITTPTEAAAIGAFGGLVMLIAYGKFTLKSFYDAFVGTVSNSAMILTIVFSAYVFGQFLAESRVTPTVVEFVGGLNVSPVLIVAGVVIVYLVLGFFMDQMAIIALTVPVTLPLVTGLGYDPIWFGIVVILVAEIGLITPPLGLNAFVAARASRVPIETVFRGSIPFIIAMLVVVVLVFFLPDLALFLPDKMTPNE